MSSSCSPTLRRGLSRRSSASFSLQSPSLNSVRLRRIFDLFDKNGDGILSLAEFGRALSTLGLDADASDLESVFSSHIGSGQEGLLFDDFVALHKWLDEAIADKDDDDVSVGDDENDLSEAFKVFDEDGDGYISAMELQLVLEKLGLVEGKEMRRVEEMIGSVDQNHDGRVDFFEFKDMMRGVITRS